MTTAGLALLVVSLHCLSQESIGPAATRHAPGLADDVHHSTGGATRYHPARGASGRLDDFTILHDIPCPCFNPLRAASTSPCEKPSRSNLSGGKFMFPAPAATAAVGRQWQVEVHVRADLP